MAPPPLAHDGLASADTDAYPAAHQQKGLLRLLTCGSVDDGKSTLIGRLLHDSQLIYEDVLASLEADSAAHGSAGDQIDLALLMDGLRAEREQGITIDVAYRYFSTARRTFIIADTPGHPQYTRNMATGASTCDLAVILIDARHGVLAQTKRHSHIASLLGIRQMVVAVNKMDRVGWSRERFAEICEDYRSFATALEFGEPYCLPMSALLGDNVVHAGRNLDWFDGPPLLEHLETVEIDAGADTGQFRMPVQLVSRPNADFRGYAGTIASGALRPGDEVMALPSGLRSAVDRIVTFDGDLDVAGPRRAVTVTLADEIDISRGDLLVTPGGEPLRAHDLDATVVWMSEAEAAPGSSYLLQTANTVANCTVRSLQHRIDIDTGAHEQTSALELNDIGRCVVTADRELVFDPYSANRATGSFVLIDRLTNATVAAGMIAGAASPSFGRRPVSRNIVRSEGLVTSADREALFGHRSATVWFTGLPSSGKSTLAFALEAALLERGIAAYVLDGDNIRFGLNRDLGFAPEDRTENIRRIGEVCHLFQDAGIVVLTAFISPYAADRDQVRAMHPDGAFVEVFVDTPLDVCEARDPKGLYAKARAGEIPDFSGISAPYEPPLAPEITIDTTQPLEHCVAQLLTALPVSEGMRG